MSLPLRPLCATVILCLSACGSSEPGPSPSGDGCEDVEAVVVGPGESVVLEASAAGGCIVLPAAGSAPAEYLVVYLSGSGLQLPNGVTGPARIASPAPADAALRSPAMTRRDAGATDSAGAFHARLRSAEATIAAHPKAPPRVMHAVVPPLVGDTRTFQVCATTSCRAFVPVTATARAVGTRTAVYLDDTVPAGGFTESDIAQLGQLFEQYIYPIDTTAFGRETDLDGNGVVAVLLSDAVNALSGSCNGGLVLGYFFGLDLQPGEPGSNGGEVLYSRVPDPSNPACRADRDRVLRTAPPNLIHELQHLINYGQRVVTRGGDAEHVWLNEGLSHFAEELGGRGIPDGPVQGGATSRQAQFLELDLNNASEYLFEPEASYLVAPGSSLGNMGDRGAGWLFVRWLADQLVPGDVTAATMTRALVASPETGAANVAARAGRPFDALVGEWQLANYLDNLSGFTPVNQGLAYHSINLRATLAQLFPVYPLRPDSAGASYIWAGTLRGGSGKPLRVVQVPGGGERSIRLTRSAGSEEPTDALLAARVAVARIR